MKYFTMSEFKEEYPEYSNANIPSWYIKASCEMIFSQIGLIYRDTWNETSVPSPIKEASMEQMRFMLEHDIPMVDTNNFDVGSMKSTLRSDYSSLALRILGNNGLLYRGNPINQNMAININFGE